jgi:hypothetical protein
MTQKPVFHKPLDHGLETGDRPKETRRVWPQGFVIRIFINVGFSYKKVKKVEFFMRKDVNFHQFRVVLSYLNRSYLNRKETDFFEKNQ